MIQVLQGSAIEQLRTLPAGSVHCCVTSPPYWGLRNYGVSGQIGLEKTPEEFLEKLVRVFGEVRRVLRPDGTVWMNMGDSHCSDGADRMPTTLAGPRVPSGWTNRAQPQRVRRGATGAKAKDLMMMPARVAMALQADDWYLRQQIPWVKRNPMPESADDRPTSAVEYIYLLSKSEDYFYDHESVRMASSANTHARGDGVSAKIKACGPNSCVHKDRDPLHQPEAKIRAKQNRSFSAAVREVVSSRVRRNSDWFFESGMLLDECGDPLAMVVNPQPFAIEMCEQCGTCYQQKQYRKLETTETGMRICTCGSSSWISHFATFPERMVEPCILAGSSAAGCCATCGAPWRRVVERAGLGDWNPQPNGKHDPGARNQTAKWARQNPNSSAARMNHNTAAGRQNGMPHDNSFATPETLGFEPSCSHPLFPGGDPIPCTVLDPFSGTGTTGVVAQRLGRHYIGIELRAEYCAMSRYRIDLSARNGVEPAHRVSVETPVSSISSLTRPSVPPTEGRIFSEVE